MRIAVLNGPNINRLGRRRPDKYGTTTLADITADVDATAARLGVTAVHLQSNHEGELVEFIHDHQDGWAAIVLNPAGLTPAGWSLLDAVRDTELPFAVVHISQFLAIDGKERPDIFADTATTYISGAGWRGYSIAVEVLVGRLTDASG